MDSTQGGDDLGFPRKVGNYRIEKRLGAGGMGVVYRAFDEVLQRPLAIKHLLSPAAGHLAARRFRREAQAAARLNHPAIVHIYDIVATESGDWIVMELVEGQTLSRLIHEGSLGLPQTVRLGREIAEGLAEAHGHGIIHRDLKATNVMVTMSGCAKILDFGLAKFVLNESDPDLSQAGAILGTYHAMSPEQARGLPLDHRSDLFSLGSLLYEMFTGTSPFLAETSQETVLRICSLRHLPANRLRPEIPGELSALIDLLLVKDPTLRLQSAQEAARRLMEVAASRRPAADGEMHAIGAASRDLECTLADAPADLPRRLDSPPALPLPSPARSRPSSERRQITVVCCELVEAGGPAGSFARGLDPEVLYELMLQLHTLIGEVVSRHGGHLGSAFGHRTVIYFGYPQTYEDNARRAVLTALELVAEVARMEAASHGGTPLRMALRVGIHTGPAVVSTSSPGLEPVMPGETFDAATELQELAEPGSVVVSPATGALLRKSFSLGVLPPVTLQGHDSPSTPLRVLGPLEGSQSSGAKLLPLVGREPEMSSLASRWSLASEGTGQVVLVSGEAGIGKSRLVLALRDHLGQGVQWLCCAGSPYTQSSPLRPLVDLLRQALAERPGDSPLDGLASLLQDQGHAEDLPFLALLLDLPLDGHHAVPVLSPERQRERTLEALTRWVLDTAERQPLVLLIEDLHWLDPTTLEWLDRVVAQVPTVPLFLLLTLRLPAPEPLWRPHSHVTQMMLSPLSEGEARTLITHLAGERSLPAAVRQQIIARTDGVPLFLEELTRVVIESNEAGESLEFPDTLRDLLSSRLERLGSAKEVAQLASVIGREFSFDLLAAASSHNETVLQRDLRRLVQADLVHRKGVGARTRYLFKHALVQDAAYHSLLRSTRQKFHHKIALALESGPPEAVESQPELLAHHCEQAGIPEKALGYAQLAGQRATARSAHVEAGRHFSHALALLRSLPEQSQQSRREVELLSGLGVALLATKGYASEEVEQVYARARLLVEELGEDALRFPILYGLWAFHLLRGEERPVWELSERLLELAAASDDTDLALIAHSARGVTGFFAGEHAAALPHLDEACRRYDLGRQASLALRFGEESGLIPFVYRFWSLWLCGEPDQARQRSLEALELADRMGTPYADAFGRVFTFILSRELRQPEAVRDAAERTVALSSEKGYHYLLALGHCALGWTRVQAGEVDSGMAQIIDSLAGFRRTGARLPLPFWLSFQVEAGLRAGQAAEGLQAVEEALSLARRQLDRFYEAELCRLRGELLRLDEADPAPAEASFREAIGIARSQGARSLELRAALSLATLLADRGDREQGRELLSDIYSRFSEGFGTADLREAAELLDRLA